VTAAAVRVDLRARDGVLLAAHRLGDAGGTPAVLLPGTFSNASFWLGTRGVGLARDLAAAGYDTWSLDPRGHGSSARPRPADRWTFDQWARADVPSIIGAATSAGRPAVAIGHSAGGASLLAALAAEPALREYVSAIIVVATPLPWLQPWRWAAAHALRAVTSVSRRFPARLLRLGPDDEPAGVMRQWIGWNIDRRWVGDDGTDYVARLPEVRTPVFCVVGDGDRSWSPPSAARALFDLIGSADRAFTSCGTENGFSRDFGHVDIVAGHAARAEVWPLMLDWLSTRAAGACQGREEGRN
jgi:predicted alpha/beta hydrolase